MESTLAGVGPRSKDPGFSIPSRSVVGAMMAKLARRSIRGVMSFARTEHQRNPTTERFGVNILSHFLVSGSSETTAPHVAPFDSVPSTPLLPVLLPW
jgi:hypothetical protein